MPIALDDVCRNKAAIMERSLRRAIEEYRLNPALDNYTHVDAMTLNVERSCQAAIDLATHLVARNHLGMPQGSADAFKLLSSAKVISDGCARAMTRMVGFRNIAVHEYQAMDTGVLRAIGENRWRDVVAFCGELGLTIQP